MAPLAQFTTTQKREFRDRSLYYLSSTSSLTTPTTGYSGMKTDSTDAHSHYYPTNRFSTKFPTVKRENPFSHCFRRKRTIFHPFPLFFTNSKLQKQFQKSIIFDRDLLRNRGPTSDYPPGILAFSCCFVRMVALLKC